MDHFCGRSLRPPPRPLCNVQFAGAEEMQRANYRRVILLSCNLLRSHWPPLRPSVFGLRPFTVRQSHAAHGPWDHSFVRFGGTTCPAFHSSGRPMDACRSSLVCRVRVQWMQWNGN